VRKLLIGAAAMVGMAAALEPARAADVEPVIVPDLWTAPPAYAVRRTYDWTGFRVGVLVGGTLSGGDWTSTPDGTAGSFSAGGVLVGGTLGYNLQTGSSYVVGIETDISASSTKGTVSPATCLQNCEISSPWLATARLRFGYAFNDILPYITVGVGIARLTASGPFGSERANNLGWLAGLGVEFVLLGPWTAKLEYLFTDLNGLTCNVACNGPVSINVHESVFRAGLNYRIWTN
jgi:outer membrane immunogenic protein